MREGDDIQAEEWIITTKSREKKPLSISTSVIKEEDGKVHILAIMQDISERKKAEEKLKESENRYPQLLETLQEGIWAIDKNACTTFVNPPMADMLGYTVEEMQGKSLFSFMDEEGIKFARTKLERRQRGIKEQHGFEFLKKDGTKISAIFETSPITDDHGNYVGAIAGIIDITKLNEAKEELRESKELFEKTFESQTDSIFILNAEIPPKIINCNPAATRVFGYSRQEMIGRTTQFLHVNEPTLKKFQAQVYPAISEHGYFHLTDFEMKRKDGTGFPSDHTVVPFKNKKGDRIGWVSVVRDISEQKRAEEITRKAHEEMERRVEERTVELRAVNEELRIKTGNLEEVNTALKVLLRKRNEDKMALEEKVLLNVKELVEPFLEKLKNSGLNQRQDAYVDILESNLKDIISSFSHRLSSKYLNFTPAEIQVAGLVKQGKTNKEIANLLNLSIRTICFHRENIRKKIGIKNQKTNLRTHLLSLQ